MTEQLARVTVEIKATRDFLEETQKKIAQYELEGKENSKKAERLCFIEKHRMHELEQLWKKENILLQQKNTASNPNGTKGFVLGRPLCCPDHLTSDICVVFLL